VRDFHFAFGELLQDAEAVEAGHLYVEEHQVGRVLFNEVHSFNAVLPLCD
jgi:hypothetical protein